MGRPKKISEEEEAEPKTVLNNEQYKEYLAREKQRIEDEIAKFEDAEKQREELPSVLSSRVLKIEHDQQRIAEAIMELQQYVKTLWEKNFK